MFGILTKAARDVLAERHRQVEREGYSPDHDDHHVDGSIARAAAAYAFTAGLQEMGNRPGASTEEAVKATKLDAQHTAALWPWRPEEFKSTGDGFSYSAPRRDLVRAGALILAEIERLDRAADARFDEPHGGHEDYPGTGNKG